MSFHVIVELRLVETDDGKYILEKREDTGTVKRAEVELMKRHVTKLRDVVFPLVFETADHDG